MAGIRRHIEPQVFDLLRFLIERGDTVTSREDLVAHVWKGRVVSDSAISVRVNAARKAVGDDGKSQTIIKTIPRRGFKLVVEVVEESEPSVGGHGSPGGASPVDHRPVLAVLPFQLVGGGGELDYLARGIADDIATELSRFHTIAVISTFSTFQYSARSDNAEEFAASLGASHIVTGTIQVKGPGIRLTTTLGDAVTNCGVWSERYDIVMDELFDAQDDAVYAIVSNLVSRLNEQQMSVARQKPTGKLNAYDCVLRGLKIYKGGEVAQEDAGQALFWFDRALELDPHYPRALAWRACAGSNFWSNPPTRQDLSGPVRDMELAMSVDPGDHEVHRLKGSLHSIMGEHDLADYHLSKSVELNPNDANILLRIGYYRSFLGDIRNAVNYVELAFRRNPLHPQWYWHDRGVVLFASGDYEESLSSLQRSQSDIVPRYVYECACHAALGQTEKAALVLTRIRELERNVTLDWINHAYPYRCYKSRRSSHTLTGYLSDAGLA